MSTITTVWPEAIKTALLGTSRAKLPIPTGPREIDQLLGQISQEDEAAALLATAGTVALHQQAGWQPSHHAPPVPTPQHADLPVCPAQIGWELDSILEGSRATLLPEILKALAQTNHRIPEFLLPNLLDKAVKLAQLRPFLIPVLGARGRWLASQNPVWHYASPEIETWSGLLNEWQATASTKQNALLQQLRLTQPERGRQILEHTWKSNNDALRHQLIRTLEINLSLADEPFLETALDDRNHLVRRAAADLLACLPTSRLAKRMPDHVAGLLRWTPNKKRLITVYFPPAITPAMLRDGIPPMKKEEYAKRGNHLLTQMISRVPLTYWGEQWQKTPSEIVVAARHSAWPRTLAAAFTTAASRQKNKQWAEALINDSAFNNSTGRLMPLLTMDTYFSLMQQAAQVSRQLQRNQPLFIFLRYWPELYTVEMAQFLLDLLVQHLRQANDEKPEPTLNNLFKRFGQTCPPELADTAVAQLTTIPGLNSAWQKTVNHLCQTLQLRRTLLAEINNLNKNEEK